MKVRKFLHKFGMHSIYWSSIKGDEWKQTVERKCQYCDWNDTIVSRSHAQ
jgi:hypothetical protein